MEEGSWYEQLRVKGPGVHNLTYVVDDMQATVKALENEGLVEMWKRFRNNRPQTLCRLTPSGRKRFIEYIQELERVVKDASLSEKKIYRKGGEHEQPGFSMA